MMSEQRFQVTVLALDGTTLAVELVEAPSAHRALALVAHRGALPEEPFTVRVELASGGGSLLGAVWS